MKTSNKDDFVTCVFLFFSQFSCFWPLPSFWVLIGSLWWFALFWLADVITLDLVSQHSIEIGWMAALRWRRHTSNEKIDVVDWLVLGLQIIYIFSGDASLLQIFEAVYYRRNFTKRVSICCVWRHTTFASSLNVQGYEVGQVTRASKQVFLYRLGKEPGKESDQPKDQSCANQYRVLSINNPTHNWYKIGYFQWFIALIINISYHLPDRKYFSANILAQILYF